MRSLASRLLLVAAAAIFAFGGVMHAVAYGTKAHASIAGSNLPHFMAAELQVLWLADTSTLIGLAMLFGYIAAKPFLVAKTFAMMLAAIPAGTTVLLYLFLGPFYAGHLLLAACIMVVAGGALMPVTGGADNSVA